MKYEVLFHFTCVKIAANTEKNKILSANAYKKGMEEWELECKNNFAIGIQLDKVLWQPRNKVVCFGTRRVKKFIK